MVVSQTNLRDVQPRQPRSVLVPYVLSPSKLREKWDELSLRLSRPSARTQKNAKTRTSKPVTTRGLQPDPSRIQGVIMSLLNEFRNSLKPIRGVLPETLRMLCRLLTAARSAVSKQVTSEWAVAHRCEGDTRRHFPRLTERARSRNHNQFVKPDLCAISMSD